MKNLFRYLPIVLVTGVLAPVPASAQSRDISLDAGQWVASDSVRTESYLGRPSLYINRGVALARNVEMQDGTFEYDMAATPRTTFLGSVFRAKSPRFSEVIFFRPGSSGDPQSVQYGPAFNNLGVAWQIYQGDGANAVTTIPREQWVHVRVVLAGATARMYFGPDTAPLLVVPLLAGAGGTGLGVWAGAFGRGAYFSNIRYAPATEAVSAAPPPPMPAGTITSWELSDPIGPAEFSPTMLPDLSRLRWTHVSPEAAGFVLVNRYQEQPHASAPTNANQEILVDSVMTGKVEGSKIVYARTTIDAPRDEIRRLHYGYSDGVVIYANGRPLVFNMNPQGMRGLGAMEKAGDAVYLPLKRGRNEIVFAVIELGAGWAFWGRLDP
ncbi:MAG TPA: hypothetical protein VGI92_02365 [Gemmatimonadales bacterium]|jgi:hypothetical protein